jgi:predicted acylesterase/phospholipase RssA
MTECLALVLGGGGTHGTMQVGALRAAIEAGVKPDL